MRDKWIKELENNIYDFFAKASPGDIKDILRQSNYQAYTDIDPEQLEILPTAIDKSISESGEDILRNPVLRNLAWSKAWESRFCPPDSFIFGTKKSENREAHLSVCRICRDKIESKLDMRELKNFARHISDSLPKPIKDRPKLAVGQIWSINKKLNGWGERSRYYKAPLVIVIEVAKDGTGKVAQICFDDAFMDEGDVKLGNANGFAEPWNLYRLKKKDLKDYWDSVPSTLVEKIRNEAANLRPFIPRHTIIPEFRGMEINLGRYFEGKSLTEVVPVFTWKEIFEGVIVSVNKKADKAIKLTLEGLEKLTDIAAATLIPRPAYVPVGALRGPNLFSISKDEKLKWKEGVEVLGLVPLDIMVKGNLLKIAFYTLKDQTAKPPVKIKIRGKSIPPENVSWERWNSKRGNSVLVIRDCNILKSDLINHQKTKSLLFITYTPQILNIDVLPADDEAEQPS